MRPAFQPGPHASAARRLLQLPVVRVVLAITVVILAHTVTSAVLDAVLELSGLESNDVAGLVTTLFSLAAVIGAYVLYVRWVERRNAEEFSRSGAAREAVFGFAVGTFLFTVTALVLLAVGAYTFERGNNGDEVLGELATALTAGVVEELVVRGILFRILEEYLGSWLALGLSAAAFGAIHLGNPNATVAGALAIALEAGILLGAAFMLTRRLWLAIGLHAAWNFTQSGVFGVRTSGNEDVAGLLVGHPQGSSIISGGAFGVEASLVAVLVCCVAGAVFVIRSRARGHVLAPRWSRSHGDDSDGPALRRTSDAEESQ